MRLVYLILLELMVVSADLNNLLGVKRATAHHKQAKDTAQARSSSWNFLQLLPVNSLYGSCQNKEDFIICLKQKALNALNRAVEQDYIKIGDGLAFERQNRTEEESILGTLSRARLLHDLDPIDNVLLLKADQFAQTHALKIDMSTGRDGDHGSKHTHKRRKSVGHIKYAVAALLTAMGIAGPIGLKAMAAIAGKALVISKVALTIAGIIALKKLFSQDNHEETSFQVHAGDHNRRNSYVLRPYQKSSSQHINTSTDPFRYYYEYH